jgi:hypothetical protein
LIGIHVLNIPRKIKSFSLVLQNTNLPNPIWRKTGSKVIVNDLMKNVFIKRFVDDVRYLSNLEDLSCSILSFTECTLISNVIRYSNHGLNVLLSGHEKTPAINKADKGNNRSMTDIINPNKKCNKEPIRGCITCKSVHSITSTIIDPNVLTKFNKYEKSCTGPINRIDIPTVNNIP